jgi:hypothetical protein
VRAVAVWAFGKAFSMTYADSLGSFNLTAHSDLATSARESIVRWRRNYLIASEAVTALWSYLATSEEPCPLKKRTIPYREASVAATFLGAIALFPEKVGGFAGSFARKISNLAG